MTYCCALRLEQGLVFISDTRTNAGVDHISVFRKLHTFGVTGERFIALQTAGNLATTKRLSGICKMHLFCNKSLIYIALILCLRWLI